MGQRQQIEAAAVRVLSLPSGGWGETVQARDELVEACLYFDHEGRKRYRLPTGKGTAILGRAFDAWLAHVEAQGARVHPARRRAS